MDRIESLNHTKWDCKYHIVFIPKNRRKVLYGQLRAHLGEVFHTLAQHKESRIEEGHVMRDHVHMLIAIPPKYAVSQVVGYTSKGKARYIWRGCMERARGTLRGRASGRENTLCPR
jgi:putative transposase